jgi:hypothetical protein
VPVRSPKSEAIVPTRTQQLGFLIVGTLLALYVLWRIA